MPARRQRVGRERVVGLAVGLIVVPLAAAACGGTSATPGVAKIATPTSSTASPGSSGSVLVRFTSCMRSHGVPQFPEPTKTATGVSLRIGPGNGVDPTSSQFRSAMVSCSSLLPNGGPAGPTITPSDQLDYLKAAACMRSHGLQNFPDPTFVGGRVSFNEPQGVNVSSTPFLEAAATCRKLIPPGLPYSN